MSATTDAQAFVRVVTISAGYGAGGAAIAPLLAARLGLPFADRLVPLRRIHVPPSDEEVSTEELDEEPASGALEGLALLSTAWNIPQPGAPEDVPEWVRDHIEASIRAVLDGGGGVILGRAAAIGLGHRPGAFHVRLDGPAERRAARGALWEGVPVDAARRHLEETDAARDRYARRLYGRRLDEASLYHLIVDPTVLTFDACVDVVERAARAFWSYDDTRLAADIAQARRQLAALRGESSPPGSAEQ